MDRSLRCIPPIDGGIRDDGTTTVYGRVQGSGDDLLVGGRGDDLFVFADGGGADRILGFTAGAGTDDVIDLTGTSAVRDFGALQGITSQGGSNTVINFGDGYSITLSNTDAGNLHQDDFVFA